MQYLLFSAKASFQTQLTYFIINISNEFLENVSGLSAHRHNSCIDELRYVMKFQVAICIKFDFLKHEKSWVMVRAVS